MDTNLKEVFCERPNVEVEKIRVRRKTNKRVCETYRTSFVSFLPSSFSSTKDIYLILPIFVIFGFMAQQRASIYVSFHHHIMGTRVIYKNNSSTLHRVQARPTLFPFLHDRLEVFDGELDPLSLLIFED
mmetsp:Transcript_31893/g.48791  ORF Transcript_31893/g.48791 Transcript_31893/m.48791 type:complete len:129 (+) Transcript_31893:56-442(+)